MKNDPFLEMIRGVVGQATLWRREGFAVSIISADDPKTASLGFTVFVSDVEVPMFEHFSAYLPTAKMSPFLKNLPEAGKKYIKDADGRMELAKLLSRKSNTEIPLRKYLARTGDEALAPWYELLELKAEPAETEQPAQELGFVGLMEQAERTVESSERTVYGSVQNDNERPALGLEFAELERKPRQCVSIVRTLFPEAPDGEQEDTSLALMLVDSGDIRVVYEAISEDTTDHTPELEEAATAVAEALDMTARDLAFYLGFSNPEDF